MFQGTFAAIVSMLSIGQNAFDAEVQHLLAEDAKHPPAEGGVVFIGSSSIRLWSTLAQDFPRDEVVNRGFGGSQLSDSVHFTKRLVTPLKPKMVVLFAGTNDIEAGKAAETVADDFSQFVREVRSESPSSRIAYISITPAPLRQAKWPEFRKANALIQRECLDGDNLAFIDAYALFVNADGSPRPELFQPDHLHLNSRGYSIWSKVVGPYLPW